MSVIYWSPQLTAMPTDPHWQVDAVIFDLFGVLVAFDDRLVYDRLAQHCRDPIGAAKAMRDLVSDRDLICGRKSLWQLHQQLSADVGLNSSLQDFEALWLLSYSEPMPGMRGLLRQLRGQCKLVLLSNVDPFYWPTVRSSLPELATFDATILSFEVGFSKPTPQAFNCAVTASGTPLNRCFFVDDKAENIEAAAALGLGGHLFTSCHALVSQLAGVGLQLHRA